MLVRKNRRNLLNGFPEQKSENRTALPVGEGSPAGAPFWVLYKSVSLPQTDPGLAFYGKIYNSNLPGFRKFLEMLRKIGRSIKTGLTKRFMSGTVTTSYERGCGQDDEVVRSYCRSGCQGRRRILLRRKRLFYDRHYYGRHYGVHFCCHYFHYWHNSIWLAWGTERLSL